jgi:RNA polymerase sigma-70 factor (ECF subfamily)
MATLDLEKLFQKARDGDEGAKNELFDTLRVRLRLFAHRRVRDKETAEDIVQDTLLTIVRNYQTLEVKVSFTSWVYTILNNGLANYARKAKRRAGIVTASEMIEDHAGTRADDDLRMRIVHCFRKLAASNKRYVRVLNLKHQGFSVDEICQRMNIKQNYLYVILHRARLALQACLDGKEVDGDEL